MPAHYITAILAYLQKNRLLAEGAEISLEANPESLTAEKLAAYRQAGVNRLSLGLQSAKDAELLLLGRAHTRAGFLQAYENAKRYFENINIDMIAALPGQTAESFAETLHFVLDCRPVHISAYNLILEEGTPLAQKVAKGLLALPSEEETEKIDALLLSALRQNGYERYEISNFAKPGYACRHNLVYWQGGGYLGCGAGAHSYLNGIRTGNTPNVNVYISALEKGESPVETQETVAGQEAEKEKILLSLRLTKGISLADFSALFGFDFLQKYAPAVESLQNNGLAKTENGCFFLTDKGLNVQNSAVLLLLRYL